MLFTAPLFLFFFLPLTLLLYAACPRPWRNALLTLVSLLFYAKGECWFLPYMVISIALNYYIARWLEDHREHARVRSVLALGIASDLVLLLCFKYFMWLMGNVNAVLGWCGVAALYVPHIRLPLGISFFTFHKISYKVDVYRGVAAAKKSFIDLTLYILLFPQLIAGPIVRYNEIAAQLDSDSRVYRLDKFALGVRVFIVGLAKKVLIANTCALAVDKLFALPAGQLSAPLAWLAVVGYALQIYYDFSGYSDMAIGLAHMFGFTFPQNFNYPYAAASITDFWRRWHITLSRWFRDYLYIPLGGNRGSAERTWLNLMIVFFLCGLWHGASWTFVIWGLFHGGFLVLERLGFKRALERAPLVVSHFYTLSVVLVGWVFFRANTLEQAVGVLRALCGLGVGVSEYPLALYVQPDLVVAMVLGVLGSVPLVPWLAAGARRAWAQVRGPLLVWDLAVLGTLSCLLVLSLASVAAGSYSPFIYFRF
jgi:alginate O-acetyltransferase complex protein AlgI